MGIHMDWDTFAKLAIIFDDNEVCQRRSRQNQISSSNYSHASSSDLAQLDKALKESWTFNYEKELKKIKWGMIFASIFTFTAIILYFTDTVWPFFVLLLLGFPTYMCMFLLEDKGHNYRVKTIINKGDEEKFREIGRRKSRVALIVFILNTYYFVGSWTTLGPEGFFLSDILSALILFGLFRSYVCARIDMDGE